MKCPICQTEILHGEEHHPWPQEFGQLSAELLHRIAPDRDVSTFTVDTCSQCHHGLHKAALAVWREGEGAIYRFFPAEQVRKALPFVKLINFARQVSLTAPSPRADRTKRLTVNVSASTLMATHILKEDMGFSSMDEFINTMLLGLLRRRYQNRR